MHTAKDQATPNLALLSAVRGNDAVAVAQAIQERNFTQETLLEAFFYALVPDKVFPEKQESTAQLINLFIPLIKNIRDQHSKTPSKPNVCIIQGPNNFAQKVTAQDITKANPKASLKTIKFCSIVELLESQYLYDIVCSDIIFSDFFDRCWGNSVDDLKCADKNTQFLRILGCYVFAEYDFLDAHTLFLKHYEFLMYAFAQDPITFEKLYFKTHAKLTSLAILGHHIDFAKTLIKQGSRFNPYPDNQSIIFYTEHTRGSGDVSAASQAIRSIQRTQPNVDITWIVEGDIIKNKDFIPDNINLVYISLSGLRTHASCLARLMYNDTTFIAYPIPIYPDDYNFLSLFPRSKVLNIMEYDRHPVDESEITHLKHSGVAPDALGVFIREQAKTLSLAPMASNKPLLFSILASPGNLFFGYFTHYLDLTANKTDNLLEESSDFMVTPSHFIFLALLKSARKKPNDRLITIVAPFLEEHLSDIKTMLENQRVALEAKGIFITTITWQSTAKQDPLQIPYQTQENSLGITVRLINPFPLQHQEMIHLLQISDPFCMLTGDGSFIEGIEANKVIFYQAMYWKRDFYKAMCAVLTQLPVSSKQDASAQERCNIKYIIDRCRRFPTLYQALTTFTNDGLKCLERKGLYTLRPLFLFMALQNIPLKNEKDKEKQSEIIAELIIEHEDILQRSMDILRMHLIQNRNLNIHFPAYTYAQTTRSIYRNPAIEDRSLLPIYQAVKSKTQNILKPTHIKKFLKK